MNLLDLIQDYGFLISSFIAIIVSWTTLKIQNENQEKRITVLEEKKIPEIEEKLKEMNPIWAEIKEKLAGIEATLKFLTRDLK